MALSAPNPGPSAPTPWSPSTCEIEDLHRERVARLRSFDEKRTGQRIVPTHHAQRVARLLDRVAEAVERVGVENVPGFQMGDGFAVA